MGIPLPYDTRQKDNREPTALLEALLFLSGDAMTEADISEHLGWPLEDVEEIAERLQHLLEDQRRGLRLIRVAGGYQLVTRPDLHDALQWVRTGRKEESPMALEVLAIIAFKQPVTRADIEKLRGVFVRKGPDFFGAAGIGHRPRPQGQSGTADFIRDVCLFFGMYRHGFPC